MNKIDPPRKVYVSESQTANAGRGVFALEDIVKDEVIERAPALVLPKEDYPLLKQTKLLNYYFMWTDEKDQAAVAFGFGSLYNHSYQPNTTYKKLKDDAIIEFVAIKDIKKGEEITVNYNYGNPNDKKTLWIKDVPPAGAP